MNDVGETFDSLSKSVKSSIYKTNLVIGRTQRMISEKTKINHCDRLSTADEAMNELISELRDIQARLFIIEGKASHLMLSTKEVRHSIPPTRSREPSAYLLTLNDHIFSPQNQYLFQSVQFHYKPVGFLLVYSMLAIIIISSSHQLHACHSSLLRIK